MKQNEYELLALTQTHWEDLFSKKEVTKQIKKRLEKYTELQADIDLAVSELYSYYMYESMFWYESKRNNWDTLFGELSAAEIVQEMFILVTLMKYSNIQAVVGPMVSLMQGKLTVPESVKTFSEILVQLAIKTDLWTVYEPSVTSENVIMVEANYVFDEEIKQYLANIKYLPPMLVRPKMVNCNYDYDYFNTPSSKILGPANHHNDPIALDVLNIMNGIPLKLDMFMVKYVEQPNKELDTVEKVEQFNRMAKASNEVYKQIISMGGRFFLTHKYDKRGRLYSQGYHINIQSTDYKKSLISLAKAEPLNNF